MNTETTRIENVVWDQATVMEIKQMARYFLFRMICKRQGNGRNVSPMEQQEILADCVSGAWLCYERQPVEKRDLRLAVWQSLFRAYYGRSVLCGVNGVALRDCAELSINGSEWQLMVSESLGDDLVDWLPRSGLSLRQQQVIAILFLDPAIGRQQLADQIGVPYIAVWRDLQIIKRALKRAEFA